MCNIILECFNRPSFSETFDHKPTIDPTCLIAVDSVQSDPQRPQQREYSETELAVGYLVKGHRDWHLRSHLSVSCAKYICGHLDRRISFAAFCVTVTKRERGSPQPLTLVFHSIRRVEHRNPDVASFFFTCSEWLIRIFLSASQSSDPWRITFYFHIE